MADAGGEQELIQLWVNLPARHKGVQPRYQGLQADALPVVHAGGVDVQVVAGRFGAVEGPVETHSPILALNLTGEAGGALDLPVPDGFNVFMYLLDGRVRVNGAREVEGQHLVRFGAEGAGLRIEVQQPTRALVMAGAPLDEPVVASGPFVMNTTTEILEALRDYKMGKMGILIETF